MLFNQVFPKIDHSRNVSRILLGLKFVILFTFDKNFVNDLVKLQPNYNQKFSIYSKFSNKKHLTI